MSIPSWDEIFQRAVEALPSDSFPEKNATKVLEEAGEWAAEVFDENTGPARLYEQSDVILSAVMDLKFSGHSVADLKRHAIVKLERQEWRKFEKEGHSESPPIDTLMEPCSCKQRYSIEPHGNGYALYLGRCNHRHGFNMMHITECPNEVFLNLIERLLNEHLASTS